PGVQEQSQLHLEVTDPLRRTPGGDQRTLKPEEPLIGVGFDADQREALTVGFPFTVICLVYYRWRHGAGCFTPQGQDAELDAAVTASSRK
ncbi:hypothetical protein ACTXO6_00005, partial [Corynebacterium variabile]